MQERAVQCGARRPNGGEDRLHRHHHNHLRRHKMLKHNELTFHPCLPLAMYETRKWTISSTKKTRSQKPISVQKTWLQFYLYALHFIQWALGGTIKPCRSKRSALNASSTSVQFTADCWTLLWCIGRFLFLLLLVVCIHWLSYFVILTYSCLVVNSTCVIYFPLHGLTVMICNAVFWLGVVVTVVINNNILHGKLGCMGRCRKAPISAAAVQCSGLQERPSSPLPPPSPCHALPAQGSQHPTPDFVTPRLPSPAGKWKYISYTGKPWNTKARGCS